MKKSVLDWPMFKGNEEEKDVENVGIMAGFKELFEDEDDMMEDEDMVDAAEMTDRRPDSPEILMNNLRGDMRSIDARREELADMVGYDAAMETPDEVLALLQSTLGAGIGGLPMVAQPGTIGQATPEKLNPELPNRAQHPLHRIDDLNRPGWVASLALPSRAS